MRTLGWVGLAYLYAVFAVAILPALLGDYLFYRSDPFSLSVLVLAVALGMLPFPGLAAFAISRRPVELRNRTGRWIALIAAVVILDIFLALFTLYLVHLLNLEWLNKSIKHPIQALALCIIPAAALVYAQSDKDSLIARVKHVGIFTLVISPLLIGYSIFSSGLKANTGTPRHLALIILDGWPTQYLHAYNSAAPASPLDDILPNARVYAGAHSSAVWTSAYFGTLHNGNPQVVEGEGRNRANRKSLGNTLQDRGVGVRFINYHRNGIPDTSSAHRSDHKGLRSYFLTEKYIWVPRAFGLDYHLALAGQGIGQNFRWRIRRAVFDWLNKTPRTKKNDKKNTLLEVLMPELKQLNQHHDQSFALFHTAWSTLGSGGTVDLTQIPKAQVISAPPGDANTKIRANDYQYEPDYEPVAENVRRDTMRSILQQGEYIRDFIEALRKDPALSDTVVILTADHGSMYAKGRYWYGYHPNREVIRVPFIVFDTGPKGTKDELFGTPELTSAILEFFTGPSSASGFDLKGIADGPVFSLTLRSDVHKQWFLVATYPDKAYWINLHPDGPGKTLEMKIDGYRQTETGKFDGAPPELAKSMKDILQSFGIDPEDVHRAFR